MSGEKKELVHDLFRSKFREVQRYEEGGTRKAPYLISAGSVNDCQNEAHTLNGRVQNHLRNVITPNFR